MNNNAFSRMPISEATNPPWRISLQAAPTGTPGEVEWLLQIVEGNDEFPSGLAHGWTMSQEGFVGANLRPACEQFCHAISALTRWGTTQDDYTPQDMLDETPF